MAYINPGIKWDDDSDDDMSSDIPRSTPFTNIETDEFGLSYYIIPLGTSLFRGDNSKYNKSTKEPDTSIPTTFTFYTTTPELASEYGIVFEYETTKEYRLLALDIPETLQKLYYFIISRPKQGTDRILKIIMDQYGLERINESNTELLRNTQSELDKEFTRYLCSLGFEGYATNSMKIPESGNNYTFHEELVICNPSLGVKFVEQITTGDAIQSAIETEKLRLLSQQQKKEKEKKRHPTFYDEEENKYDRQSKLFTSPVKKSSIFSEASYNSPGGKSIRKSEKRISKRRISKRRKTKKGQTKRKRISKRK